MNHTAPRYAPKAFGAGVSIGGHTDGQPARLQGIPLQDPPVCRPCPGASPGFAPHEWDALFCKAVDRLTMSMGALVVSSPVGQGQPLPDTLAGMLESVALLEELRLAGIPHIDSGPECCAGQMQRKMAESAALVAHELRNPLGPIRTASAMLVRVPSEQLPRLQAIIERQVSRMSALIADLIEVGRADAGKLRLRSEIVDMRDVVAEAVDNCEPAMHARSQRLAVDLSPGLLAVDGDPGRLVQIVSNLLDNASKYTPGGGDIGVSVTTSGGELRLIVSDNGIGISEGALPHLFERFVQEDHAIEFNGAGLGIGLAVVRELVQAHGGTVQAQSAGIGRGSCFVVSLPLRDSARAAEHPSEIPRLT